MARPKSSNEPTHCSAPWSAGIARQLGRWPSLVGLAAMLAFTVASGGARAQDTLTFSIGTALRYDDNVFRLSSTTDPQVALGKPQKSDWITTSFVGLNLDKTYSLQSFHFDTQLNRTTYATFDNQNADGRNYRGTWLWALTPRFTGEITLQQTQNSANYADFRNFINTNVATNKIQRLAADWWVTGGWHLTAATDRITSSNSAVFTAISDSTVNTAEAGIKYIARSGNSVSAIQRQSRGEYLGRALDPVTQLDNGFDQSESRLRIDLKIGASIINGELGYLERQHEHFPLRDYSGVVGRVNYNWMPTGKLQLNLTAARDLTTYQDNTESYSVSEIASVAPVWLISAKTSARLTLQFEHRDYLGPIVPTPVLREDDSHFLQLSIDWNPSRALSVSGFVQREKRSSNLPGIDYLSNSAGGRAQLKF